MLACLRVKTNYQKKPSHTFGHLDFLTMSTELTTSTAAVAPTVAVDSPVTQAQPEPPLPLDNVPVSSPAAESNTSSATKMVKSTGGKAPRKKHHKRHKVYRTAAKTKREETRTRKDGQKYRTPRAHPGRRALREIRHEQRATGHAIPAAPFARLVRDIASDMFPGRELRWSHDAIDAIQTAAEDYMVKKFDGAQIAGIHAGRQGVTKADLRLAVAKMV